MGPQRRRPLVKMMKWMRSDSRYIRLHSAPEQDIETLFLFEPWRKIRQMIPLQSPQAQAYGHARQELETCPSSGDATIERLSFQESTSPDLEIRIIQSLHGMLTFKDSRARQITESEELQHSPFPSQTCENRHSKHRLASS